MPIKSLESYLFERGLVGSYPIEALGNATLGIDVVHYVSRLLTSRREQYLDAIGGFPTSLKMYLESDLEVFKQYNITPVFVFNGAKTANQLESSGYYTAGAPELAAASSNVSLGSSPGSAVMSQGNNTSKSTRESVYTQRQRAWTQWNNTMTSNQDSYIDQPIQTQEPFRYNTMIESKTFQADLIAYFIDNDITYQVAPYVSWFQLNYLLHSGFVDAIYGPTDCLMLKNVDRFILGMEFPNKEFRYIDRNRVLKELKCDHDEFIDIAMAVGNDLQQVTLPPLQIYAVPQLFDMALEMVLSTGTNFYAYQISEMNNSNDNHDYQIKYQRGISTLRYMPVLLENGRVEIYTENEEPLALDNKKDLHKHNSHANKAEAGTKPSSQDSEVDIASGINIPNDVHEFIAQKFPPEYYFYRSIGLVNGTLFDAITTGIYPEEPPLGGGSANSYRNLVKQSVDLFKNKEINLLTQSINRYYQIKRIKQVPWFAPDNGVELINRTFPLMFDRINHIVVKTDGKVENFSIGKFIETINNSSNYSKDFIADQVIFPNSVSEGNKLTCTFDLLSTSFLRFLVLLDFFEYNSSDQQLSPTKWGQVLLKINDLKIDADYHESFLILMMFLKTGVLSLSEDTVPDALSALSQATLRSYPEESLYILVITRLFSLYQIKQKPSNYHGPIDKKTLIFRDHLDFVRENMNQLFESVIVSSLTAGEFDRLSLDNVSWAKLVVRRAPFKANTPNTIMAMVWEFFLQKYLHNGNSKADAIALVVSEFNTYKSTPNLEEQLYATVKFLEACVLLLNELSDYGLIKQGDAILCTKALEFVKKAAYSV